MAALRFEHRKLAVVASVRQDDFQHRLEEPVRASQKVVNGQRTQVIEPPKAEAGLPTPELLDR